MLALLMPFLGILGSVIPSIVRIFEKKQEYAHDVEMAKIQATAQFDVETVKAAAIERQAIYDHDKSLDGGKFINALRASIRPIITYTFFFLFVAVKWAAAYVMIEQGADIPTMLSAVWDADTMALFSTILGFWFGSRVMEKHIDFNFISAKKADVKSVKTTNETATTVKTKPSNPPKKPAGTGRDK
jgi:hypothetical protein